MSLFRCFWSPALLVSKMMDTQEQELMQRAVRPILFFYMTIALIIPMRGSQGLLSRLKTAVTRALSGWIKR